MYVCKYRRWLNSCTAAETPPNHWDFKERSVMKIPVQCTCVYTACLCGNISLHPPATSLVLNIVQVGDTFQSNTHMFERCHRSVSSLCWEHTRHMRGSTTDSGRKCSLIGPDTLSVSVTSLGNQFSLLLCSRFAPSKLRRPGAPAPKCWRPVAGCESCRGRQTLSAWNPLRPGVIRGFVPTCHLLGTC